MNPLFKQASKPCCLMTPSFPFIKFGRSRIEKISHLFDQKEKEKKKKKKRKRSDGHSEGAAGSGGFIQVEEGSRRSAACCLYLTAMARYGGWTMRKLTVAYCEFSGSSRGAR